jgi:hypothetical protein
MKSHQGRQQHRHHRGVESKKEPQGLRAQVVSGHQNVLQGRPDPGQIGQHAGGHRHRPVGQLIPGQQITGEVGQQDDAQLTQADDPVELPGGMKGAREKDPQQVKEDHQHQQVGAPVMQVAHQAAEGHGRHQRLYGGIGRYRRRLINEFEKNAGDQLHHDQHNCRATQTPRQGEAQGGLGNRGRPEMQRQEALREPSALGVTGRDQRPLGFDWSEKCHHGCRS